MTDEMVRLCAMRVLYQGRKLSVEIFHALTDGYGGFIFLQALAEEYIGLARGTSACRSSRCDMGENSSADDYRTYAGKTSTPFQQRRVFQFPNRTRGEADIHTVTGICSLRPLLEFARRLDVSLTSLLTAVMASSAAEIQARYSHRRQWRPIQILVPVNLRKRFPSTTLRNFTLYALPCVEKKQLWLSAEALAVMIDRQIKEQLSEEHLSGMMSTQVRLQTMPLAVHAPLSLKMGVLKSGSLLFGGQGSCLTLSNLGAAAFPKELRPFVERVEFLLTPPKNAPYNCGVTSYDGKLYIGFARRERSRNWKSSFSNGLTRWASRRLLRSTGRPSAGEPEKHSALPESDSLFNISQTKRKQPSNDYAVS